jgi:ribonucleoside-triphosphate reductase (thioredoxin)
MSIKQLQEFTRIARYARYNPDKGRRETWIEQTKRVIGMHRDKYADIIDVAEPYIKEAEIALKKRLVLGSQRALQFGGPAILKKEARLYNCVVSYADRTRFFQETIWLLLCGCGVGFSVQKHHVAKIPKISAPGDEQLMYQVPDSIEGWADAIGVLMSSYFVKDQPFPAIAGKTIKFDYSLIRPKGAKIGDTNGKAPGPDGLKASIEKIRSLIDARLADGNTKLRPIDVYDIVMHTSDAVLSGGVRRSATIAMFTHDDEEMATAKTGDWFTKNPQRGRSNNSAVLLRNEVTREEFGKLFSNVKEFGEPGFIWSDSTEALYNPCVEIGMQGYDEKGNSGWAFCNLCEINVKMAKTKEEFFEMCRYAAVLGTLQAGYTSFPYLEDPKYGYNVTEAIVRREALLGCSMTGMMDNPEISFDPEIQREGAKLIRKVNAEVADAIGINHAARTTCVKPAGSTSAILGTASGIHPHHAKRYFRRVQANKMEGPLQFFKQYNPEAVSTSVWSTNKTDDVITFICEVPTAARTKNDTDAIQLLEHVKLTQQNWIEAGTNKSLCVEPWLRHNVSNTINVKPDEWKTVESYIFKNRKWIAGISLLPMTGDKDYAQAPFQAVYTRQELNEMYGDASMFASGLIVHAHKAFDENLYAACDSLLNIGEQLPDQITTEVLQGTSLTEVSDYVAKVLAKKGWVARANKFTKNYFLPEFLEPYGVKELRELPSRKSFTNECANLGVSEEKLTDLIWTKALRKMTYCLKDVDALKTWVDLDRSYVDIPWDDFMEVDDNTKLVETAACSGGQCEITKV